MVDLFERFGTLRPDEREEEEIIPTRSSDGVMRITIDQDSSDLGKESPPVDLFERFNTERLGDGPPPRLPSDQRPSPGNPLAPTNIIGNISEALTQDLSDVTFSRYDQSNVNLLTRTIISAAEAFNEPFRKAVNFGFAHSPDPMIALMRRQHASVYGEGAEMWPDQRDRMTDPATTAERSANVGGETMGAIGALFFPMSGAARMYSSLTGSAGRFLRGMPPESFFLQAAPLRTAPASERLANQAQNAALSLRQAPEAMARSYLQRPNQNAFMEASSAMGAGLGAGMAEAIAPGSVAARGVGEIVGGIAAPVAMVSRVGMALYNEGPLNALKNVFSNFSSETRHKVKLAKHLETATQEYLRAQGIDVDKNPEAVANEIQRMLASMINPLPTNAQLTPGMRSQHPVLLAWEKDLARRNPQYAGDRTKLLDAAFKEYDAFVNITLQTAAPDTPLFKMAAKMQYARNRNIIEDGLQNAEREFAEAVSRLDFSDSGMQDASDLAAEIIGSVVRRSRAAERALWGEVDGGYVLLGREDSAEDALSNTLAALKKIRQQVTLTNPAPMRADFSRLEKANQYYRLQERLNAAEAAGNEGAAFRIAEQMESIAASFGGNRPLVRAQTLLNIRRDLMDEARTLRSRGELNRARMHETLANGIIEDLNRIDAITPKLTAARNFTRAFHDAFDSTFMIRATGVTEGGDPRIAPEDLLEIAFGTGGRQGAERFAQITDAATFSTLGFPPEVLGPDIIGIQESFLRANLTRLVNVDGVITQSKLHTFLNNPHNRQVLSEMPTLAADLGDIQTAQANVILARANRDARIDDLETSALGALIGDIHPDRAVRNILTRANSGEGIAELAAIARESGESAVNGLKHSLMKAAFDRARIASNSPGESHSFSYARMMDAWTTPVTSGNPSIRDMLRTNRIMTEAELKRMDQMFAAGLELERSMADPGVLEAFSLSINPFSDLALRIAGAKVGAAMAGASGTTFQGHGLIAAGAGSRMLTKYFSKFPLLKLKELQVRAASNPEFFAEVMMTRHSPEKAPELIARFNLFMINAGMLSAEDITLLGLDYLDIADYPQRPGAEVLPHLWD